MSNTPTDDERLPCGAAVDELLDQVADRRPPTDPEHQAGCVHCRAAVAELSAMWAPMRDLADERVRAPTGLLDAVMDRVRRLASDAWHAVLESERGVTRIAAWVVAAIARLAAARIPGVSYVFGHAGGSAGGSDGASTVGVAGRRAVIDLELVASYGPALPELAQRVRALVAREVTAMTGLEVTEVNVAVADLDTEDEDRDPDAADA